MNAVRAMGLATLVCVLTHCEPDFCAPCDDAGMLTRDENGQCQPVCQFPDGSPEGVGDVLYYPCDSGTGLCYFTSDPTSAPCDSGVCPPGLSCYAIARHRSQTNIGVSMVCCSG